MDYIESIRKNVGITVTELCEKVGVSRKAYYKWLNRETKPKMQNIIKICEVLKINFAENVDKFL